VLIAPTALFLLSGGFSPQALWDAWPARRFVPTRAPCLRHAELVERLRALEARHRHCLTLEEVGRSVQGRPLYLATLGTGSRKVLLWSQMHGDEPSATPALLDVADTLLSWQSPETGAILDGLTLLMVPMLNPDGAERYVRRNAQAIDVNRDALSLTTPEGHALKAVRDRFQPELGANLHDQNRRTTVGTTGALATISLLAVSGDRAGTLTPGRARAKRVCSAVARTLAPFVPGGVARYDEDWNPRAFGDNLTAWGTPVVLIESGGVPPVDLLEVAGPPATPSGPGLEAALESLTSGSWRTKAAGRPLSDLLGDLAGASTPGPIVAPDTRASLVILKPHAEGAQDVDRSEIESVLLDGRAPGGGD
jgi:zinc carboxypeptidase